MFSANFAFVKVNHNCTLASALLQYNYFAYKLYIFEDFLLSKTSSKFTPKHNNFHLATISLFMAKFYKLHYEMHHISFSASP